MVNSIGGIYSVMDLIEKREKKGVGLEKIVIAGEQGYGGCRSPLGAPGDSMPTEFYIRYAIMYDNGHTDHVNEKSRVRFVEGKFRSEVGEWPQHLQNIACAIGKIMLYMVEQANELGRKGYKVEIIDRKDKYRGNDNDANHESA